MLLKHGGFVYIVTNKNNTVLYTGVTSELRARIDQHKSKYHPNSFTAKYNCNKIVWYERFDYIEDAIAREKQIKAGNRKAKESLINSLNPAWKDLWDDIQDL
jgi:putative endonuclease